VTEIRNVQKQFNFQVFHTMTIAHMIIKHKFKIEVLTVFDKKRAHLRKQNFK